MKKLNGWWKFALVTLTIWCVGVPIGILSNLGQLAVLEELIGVVPEGDVPGLRDAQAAIRTGNGFSIALYPFLLFATILLWMGRGLGKWLAAGYFGASGVISSGFGLIFSEFSSLFIGLLSIVACLVCGFDIYRHRKVGLHVPKSRPIHQ